MPIQGIVLWVVLFPALAADDPGKFFDEIFAVRVKAALATRDRADDLALARSVLDAAGTLNEAAAARAAFAQRAYDLVATIPEGLELALEATRMIREADPARAAESRDLAIRVLKQAMNRGTAEERKKVSQWLIHESVSAGDALETSDPAEAASHYRQALTVALQSKDPQAADIRAKVEQVNARALVLRRIAQLQEKLLGDANDTATARALVELLVTEQDNPAAAAQPSKLAGDTALAANVAAAQLPASSWTEPQAHALAQWYHDLAGEASLAARPVMLRKSAAAYGRFLETHTASDAPGLKAVVILKEIERELSGTGASTPSTAANPKPASPPVISKEKEKDDPSSAGIPSRLKDFAIAETIEFTARKNGYVIETWARVTAPNAITITVGPGVEIKGGAIHLERNGHLHIKGTADSPAVLRDVTITQDLSASMKAEHVIFDNVTFRKGGGWFASYSTRWTFANCLLHKCVFPRLHNVDYGFKFDNCSFTFMTFPETEGPYQHEWRTLKSCNFIGCAVSPSIAWCAESSNFYACEFPAGVKYKGSDLTKEMYFLKTKGLPPQKAWLSEPDAGKITITAAAEPFTVFKFKTKPAIAELRSDKTIAGVLFE